MEPNEITLSAAKWNVMECLWDRSPQSGREVVEQMGAKMGWSRSTTLTLLRRMEAKGAITADADGAVKQFRPLLSREDAVLRETDDFLSRVYQGSLSLMVSSMTKKQALSREELHELYSILKELEEE